MFRVGPAEHTRAKFSMYREKPRDQKSHTRVMSAFLKNIIIRILYLGLCILCILNLYIVVLVNLV